MAPPMAVTLGVNLYEAGFPALMISDVVHIVFEAFALRNLASAFDSHLLPPDSLIEALLGIQIATRMRRINFLPITFCVNAAGFEVAAAVIVKRVNTRLLALPFSLFRIRRFRKPK